MDRAVTRLRATLLPFAVFLVTGMPLAKGAEEKGYNMSKKLVVALLQMDPAGNDQDANLKKADLFCRKAAEDGADVALMPEMWNIGYTRFDPDKEGDKEAFWKQAAPKDGPWVQHFAGLAKELRMAIAVSYEQAWDPLPRNAVTLFDREGREVYTYAKVHTSDFKSMERSMTPGDGFFVGKLETKKGTLQVGSMICFDREQPESARILMLKGAELILTPNACTLEANRIGQFSARAYENMVGVAMANYASPEQNGHSVAFDADGSLLVEAGKNEGIHVAEFDMDTMREYRAKSVWGNAFRRPHRYGLLTSCEVQQPFIRTNAFGEVFDRTRR